MQRPRGIFQEAFFKGISIFTLFDILQKNLIQKTNAKHLSVGMYVWWNKDLKRVVSYSVADKDNIIMVAFNDDPKIYSLLRDEELTIIDGQPEFRENREDL